MTITVEFTLTHTGKEALVEELRRGPHRIPLTFAEGAATAHVEPGLSYSAPWKLKGDIGAKIKVVWKAEGLQGTMIDGFIDEATAMPWPEGPWLDQDSGLLPPLSRA